MLNLAGCSGGRGGSFIYRKPGAVTITTSLPTYVNSDYYWIWFTRTVGS
jgi:hypothetical protein